MEIEKLYEQRCNTVKVDDVYIPVECKEFPGLKIMEAVVGTNGHQMDWYQTTTYLSLENLGCACLKVGVDGSGVEDCNKIEIVLRGDEELDDFIKALEFSVQKLKEMRDENKR